MLADNSTAPIAPGKPEKPSDDYPLFAHATRRWAKKFKGKLHYFGPWDDPAGALKRYEQFLKGKPSKPPRKRRRDATHAEAPPKPYPDFPLFPHATGRWAKKIRGRMTYFGKWNDPDGALTKYLAEKDDLLAGRKPRDTSATAAPGTIKDTVNRFLNAKQYGVDSGELTKRSWQDYKAACDLIVSHFRKWRLVADLEPDDFLRLRRKLAAKWGPVTLGNVIQRIRVVFKFAWDEGIIDRPVRYGQAFKRPSRKTIRIDRAQKGPKLFTAAEVRRLIANASPAIKAMTFLGINSAFGNADCGRLPRAAVDLAGAAIDFPRPKTGIKRRCYLWPETVKALRKATAVRPDPKDEKDAGLVFITKYGQPWAKDTADQTLAKEFGKLLRTLRINGRKGLGFYTLRHTFRTVADESKDQPAVDYIMGHESPHTSTTYIESIADKRLRAVANYVHRWLFGKSKARA
jgi:integrase